MTSQHREVERKFDGRPEPLLDLTRSDGVGAVLDLAPKPLRATYYDTTDLRLAARGVTLRERTGDRDAGWHLKVPVRKGEKLEVRLSAGVGGEAVPDELRTDVRALTRDAALVPVIRLRTMRQEQEVLDDGRHSLAVVAFDEVTAELLLDPAGRSAAWSEVEVELVDGDGDLLDELSQRVVEAGLRPSNWRSKLEHALADTEQDPSRSMPTLKPGSGGAAVVEHLCTQLDALELHDVGVRCGQADAVHQMRVATRRMRSALATYRPLLAGARWEAARDELKWLGEVLGHARDAEVMRSRLDQEVASLPGELVLGPVRTRIAHEMSQRQAEASAAVTSALGNDRYVHLLEELESLVSGPPMSERASGRAGKVLSRPVRKAQRRVRRAHRAFEQAGERAGSDARLHEVRKAAKRARYAAESAEPGLGRPARRTARRMEALQELLGEHQDTVAAREVIRSLGIQAYLAGENGYTFGLLHGLEMSRAEAARSDYPAALRSALASARRL